MISGPVNEDRHQPKKYRCRSYTPRVELFNNGGYSNPKVDQLVDLIQVETAKAKRLKLIAEALGTVKEDFGYIPLHQQVVVWAVRENVEVSQGGDNFFQLRYVKVK
jgi:peptide/nickel transport system substrate-binding protein